MRPRTPSRSSAILAGAFALALPAAARAQAQPAPAPAPAPQAAAAPSATAGTLEVTVSYKGKGDVSATNEISLFLFSDPNIGPDSMPVGVATVEQNGGTATFSGMPPVVYIVAVYDDVGTYERQAAPPSGTPVALYGISAGGVPEGVKTGNGAKVTFTFDDSNRMP
jgi:hypothetical protein